MTPPLPAGFTIVRSKVEPPLDADGDFPPWATDPDYSRPSEAGTYHEDVDTWHGPPLPPGYRIVSAPAPTPPLPAGFRYETSSHLPPLPDGYWIVEKPYGAATGPSTPFPEREAVWGDAASSPGQASSEPPRGFTPEQYQAFASLAGLHPFLYPRVSIPSQPSIDLDVPPSQAQPLDVERPPRPGIFGWPTFRRQNNFPAEHARAA